MGIFHLGDVQFRYLTGFGKYTFDAKQALKSAKLLGVNTFIPIHYSGWSHSKEVDGMVKSIFSKEKLLFNFNVVKKRACFTKYF
ncbi:MAG: hypothetical protein L3J06_04735 [Cyclobacteriaceae bacterium]|nr:hypothetical protein [Cyclobacteriaceae bacterium]